MFDVAPTELLLVAIVALLVIGPKDLPKAMRFVGQWVGKARGVARQFRSGFDTMVREAELADMEKKWAEENARIMREHPMTPTPTSALPDYSAPDYTPPTDTHTPGSDPVFSHVEDTPPVMVEQPVVRPAFSDAPRAPTDPASS